MTTTTKIAGEAIPLTQDELKELFLYDAETGHFWHRQAYSGQKRKSLLAGSVTMKGYIKIKIRKKFYFAHRLAWLYVYGKWPAAMIDHIDSDPKNNRLSNLREATRAENGRNRKLDRDSKTGVKGVCYHAATKKYLAQLRSNGKRVYAQLFNTVEEAERAIAKEREKIHGEFCRHA